jgi:murein DD-endopeptidase MepM/ murein hydrolase activator NlpD
MVNPVPGNNVDTPYGRRGSWWSCNEDSNGNGIHTGVDYAAPTGTKVVAARPGKVVHCNHGSAFGYHQIEILPGDGTRDFYAHLRSRVGNGVQVKAGDKVGEVGSEGNATGPHLHFERHKVATGGWSCSVVVDPAPSINYDDEPEDEMTPDDWDKMRKIVREEVEKNNKAATDSVWNEPQTVTKSDGKDTDKSMRQIQRETWQRVANS